MNARSVWAVLLFTSAVAGCGDGGPELVPVSGRVTFDGQPPPAAGSVYFLPQEPAPGVPSRPATGDFGADGQFTAKTYAPGDGLLPAKYTMHVECWAVPPNMDGRPSKSHVPAKYQKAATSGFEVDITPGTASKEVDLDVKTK